MKFSTKNILKIISKYNNELNTFENRKILIDELNIIFFPDNIAKFIDYTNISSTNIIDDNGIRIMIEYKNIHYNILAFKVDILSKIQRIRKLKQLNKL